ncbi:Imm50 family immunity protein [Agaribacterium sp. ZY112]|uniref:Imm50 family immunity protein n=1 Tax=Agaribacterium sp. ZY112 TaxID=3233574 RepID=UPI003523C078
MCQFKKEIKELFGYWPKFCDGRITDYQNTGDNLNLQIDYIDSDQDIRAVITITFIGITNQELSTYEPNSVVDELSITPGSKYKVQIDSCFGLSGIFNCQSIQVNHVNA